MGPSGNIPGSLDVVQYHIVVASKTFALGVLGFVNTASGNKVAIVPNVGRTRSSHVRSRGEI